MKPEIPGQGQLFDPAKVRAEQFEPLRKLQVHARRIARGIGGDYTPPNPQQQVDHQRGFAQYKAYEEAQAAPESPTVRKSYEVMRQHVNQQYDHMTKPREQGGMGISVEVHDKEPYGFNWSGGNDGDARTEMHEDFTKNNRIKVLSTKATGAHAVFSDDENDRFRAVHDVFGHMAIGRGFSRHGEEAAWESHRQMFPKEAHEALTSETRGQNSYLNYSGGKGFPDQSGKLVGLPEWANQPGRLNLSQAGQALPKKGRM